MIEPGHLDLSMATRLGDETLNGMKKQKIVLT